MAGKGLYANIAAKKARIKAGSGEKMRKKGAKGAPTSANFRRAAGSVANTFNSSPIFTDFINFRVRRTGKGHFNPWASKSPKLNPFKSFGWGTWIRTRDHGIKTRCLTTWLCPNLQRKNKRFK